MSAFCRVQDNPRRLEGQPCGKKWVHGRCPRVWWLYDYDVVWILDDIVVFCACQWWHSRHHIRYHTYSNFIWVILQPSPISVWNSAGQWLLPGIRPRESHSWRKNVRARCSLNPSASEGQWLRYWVWLGYVAICCDWFGVIKWSMTWRTCRYYSCSSCRFCRSSTQFALSNQDLSS